MSNYNELLQKLHQINLDKQENLLPENIRKGVTALGVEGTLEEVIINNQDKTITENGTYTADEGYTGLGNITVNVEGSGSTVEGMQQFSSEEEMQEQGIKEYGRLATVYGATVSNMTASTEIQHITFPKTVVLPEAVTESKYCMIMSMGTEYGDGNVELSPTYFTFFFRGMEAGIRAEYSSADGITYTRTDANPETLDFGMPVGCAKGYEDMWDDNFGYFAQCSIPYYGGIFNYGDYTSDEYVKAGVLSDTKPVDTIAYVKPLFDMMPDIHAHIPLNIEGAEIKTKRVKYYTVAQISDTKYELYTRAHYRSGDSMYEFFECGVKRNSTTSTWHICPHSSIASASIPVIDTTSEAMADNTAYMMFKYEVDTETKTFTCTQLRASEFTSYVENSSNKIIYQLYNQALDTSLKLFGIYYSHILTLYLFNYATDGTGSNFQTEWAILQKYVPAQTQLTAASNTVGKDQIFYGVNGLEVGTASLTEISNQDKTVTPTIETQTVTADSSYTGLGTVTVDGVTSAIDANIIPENIKKDVSILGVTGTLQEASNEPIDIEGAAVFSTVEEMNATAGNEGDLAIVYENTLEELLVGETYESIYCPPTITFDAARTGTTYIYLNSSSTSTFNLTQAIKITATKICFVKKGSMFSPTELTTVVYSSNDGLTYTRTDSLGEVVTIAEIYADAYTNITIQETNYDILKQMFKARKVQSFGGVFRFIESSWVTAPSQLDATADVVFGSTYFGADGVNAGTLGQNPSEAFTDGNAKVFGTVQSAYEELTPIVLTEESVVDKGMYVIPTKCDGTPLIDTSNLTSLYGTFEGCTNLITVPKLDLSNATELIRTFYGCSSLRHIAFMDTSKIENFTMMFQGCSSLQSVPFFDTSNATRTQAMFNKCSSLKHIPVFDTSKVTNAMYMFVDCKSLLELPAIDTSQMTDAFQFCSGCTLIETVPFYDFTNLKSMSYMFQDCPNLKSVPAFNTPNITSASAMFKNCTSLTDIPVLNFSNVTSASSMVSNCPNLTNNSLNNILAMLASATGYTSTKTLKEIGLTSAQATTCTTLSNYSAFTSAGWTTGY